jgi:hypothetical protein
MIPNIGFDIVRGYVWMGVRDPSRSPPIPLSPLKLLRTHFVRYQTDLQV